MTLIRFKFKKADAATKVVAFDKLPSWKDLTSKIAHHFSISSDRVGVAYVDKDKEAVTLNMEEDLQVFYGCLEQSSDEIKLVVQDLTVPDPSIPSTWSVDSNLSDPMKSDDDFKLFCCVPSSNSIFPVDIAKAKTVGDLKKAIKKEKEPELDYLPADALDLWQVSLPINTSLKDKLNKLVLDEDESLLPAKRLFKVFRDQPEEEHLHIVVRAPPAAQSIPRKRHRAEVDGTEEMEDVQHVGPSGVYTSSLPLNIDDITAIHRAIRDLPDTTDFANPAALTLIPFPSPLTIPFQGFQWQTQDNVSCFSYMGRSKFTELYTQTQGPNFVAGYEAIYLYGPSGSGKSHILAALVCRLIREGKRIVYIPDCIPLLDNFTFVIRSALCFAFYDSEQHLKTIGSARNEEDLIKFWEGHRDVYLVVDQLNALDLGGRSINMDNVKKKVTGYLRNMKAGHRYIFSASANEQSNQAAVKKQSGTTVIPTRGGMTQEETDYWFIHHAARLPPLSADQRQLVDYLTGRIPLLLRVLFDQTFEELVFMSHGDLRKVYDDITEFFINKQNELKNDPVKKNIYFDIMDACLQSRVVGSDMQDLYDLRYFYVDPSGVGHCTCGIALESMMLIYRKHRLIEFCGEEWYSAVERSLGNPVVQGFLAEHICLSHILSNGLLVVNTSLGRMQHTSFQDQPNWDQQLSSNHTIHLYIPTTYNFRAVDAVILLVDYNTKKVHMYPIQITLSMRHKPSDEDFYSSMWWQWVKPLKDAGYTVESTFVWIDKTQPADHIKSPLVRNLRSGPKIVQPKYCSVHVGIGQVDPKLAARLGL